MTAAAKERNHKVVDEVTPLLSRQRQGSLEMDAKKNPAVTAKKPSPWFIIAPLFGLTFCFGALFAPMIQFYTVVFCNKYYQSQTGDSSDIPLENCAIPEVQAIVSEAQAIIMFLTYGSTLLVASFYGALSDRKGRRLVLKISAAGNILLMLSYLATIKYQSIFGVSLLFIAPIVRGFLGGDSVLIAAIQAYISDCTSTAERTIVFGRMLGSIFLGTTVGPTVASLLIKQTGTITSIFYMVLAISTLFELYVCLLLPESHDHAQFELDAKQQGDQQEQTLLQRLNVFSALQILYRTAPKYANRYALPLIAGAQFFLTIVALPPVFLYAMLMFGWTAVEGGLFISLSSFSKLIILTFVLPLLSKLFHHKASELEDSDMIANPKIIVEEFIEHDHIANANATSTAAGPSTSTTSTTIAEDAIQQEEQQVPARSEAEVKRSILFDTWMIRAGLTAEVICLVIYGLVKTSNGFALNAVVQSLAALALPSLRSLTTTLVSANEVGELLGAMAVVESFGMIISQLTINTIYSASVGTMPQLTFFVCAGIAGLALLLVIFVKPMSSSSKNIALQAEEEGRNMH